VGGFPGVFAALRTPSMVDCHLEATSTLARLMALDRFDFLPQIDKGVDPDDTIPKPTILR